MISRFLSVLDVSVTKDTVKEVGKAALIVMVTIAAVILALKGLGVPSSVIISVLGVKTELSSWTLIMIALFWFDANLYVRRYQRGASNFSYATVALLLAIMVMASVVLHEFAHAAVALGFGYKITQAGMSWWGAFVAPAKDVISNAPLEQTLISLAGPLANLILSGISACVVVATGESISENSFQYLALVNYRLAKWNLIPFIIMLDGGRALQGLIQFLGFRGNTANLVTIGVGAVIYGVYRSVSHGKKSVEDSLAKL